MVHFLGRSLNNLEATEADELDRMVPRQDYLDGIKDCIHHRSDYSFRLIVSAATASTNSVFFFFSSMVCRDDATCIARH